MKHSSRFDNLRLITIRLIFLTLKPIAAVVMASLFVLPNASGDPIPPVATPGAPASNVTTVTWSGPLHGAVLIFSHPESTGFWRRGGQAAPVTLNFFWTNGFNVVTGQPSPNPAYQPYTVNLGGSLKGADGVYIYAPPFDPSITDFSSNFPEDFSSLTVGNFGTFGSSMQFSPLANLLSMSFQIPQFAPVNSAPTIYEAVDLKTYVADNPEGFLNGNYAPEDTLDELGLQIVNGQIPGVEGLYFATSPFDFDPTSSTGYVPSGGAGTLLNSNAYEAEYGPAAIIQTISTTPEPSSGVLLITGLMAFAHRFRRRLQRSRDFGSQ